MRTLVLAAHPDDEILGVGGTLLKRVEQGHDVFVAIICDCLSPRNTEEIRLKVRETSKAIAKKIGVKKLFFESLGTDTNQRIDELPFSRVIDTLYKIVREVRPEEIFTHHYSDWNTDHQVIFNATISTTRTFLDVKVKNVYSYEVPSSTEQAPNLAQYSFIPNKFVDISKYLDKKIELLSMYDTEVYPFPHTRSLEVAKMTAKLWGAKNNVAAAEAFVVIREIE